MTSAIPYSAEELEQVRAHKDIPLTLAGVGDIKSSIMRLELRPDPSVRERQLILDTFRLLATLAERDALLSECSRELGSNAKLLQLQQGVIDAFNARIAELEAQLTASHNAALERACGAICYGCARGWPVGYHKDDRGPNKLLMHYADGNEPGEPGHVCHAQAIRTLMTKE